MLHRHVETFLDHWVLIGDISTRANLLVGPRLVDIAVLALVLETSLTSVEDHSILQVTVSRLAESSRSAWVSGVGSCDGKVLVFTWPWNVKLKALPIEDMVRVEARRGDIEANLLARESFIVGGSHLLGPVGASVKVGYNSISGCASSGRIPTHHGCRWVRSELWLCLGQALLVLSFQDSDVRILHIYVFESLSCRFEEHTLSVRSLRATSRSGRCIFLYGNVRWESGGRWITKSSFLNLLLLGIDSFINEEIIMAWSRSMLSIEHTLLKSLRVGTECTELDTMGLSESAITGELQEWFTDWWVQRVIDVNVCSGARYWLLVHWLSHATSLFARTEWYMDCFFDKQSCLDIILLFLMIVLSRSRIHQVGRMSVRRLDSIDPEVFLSLCRAQEVLISSVHAIAAHCAVVQSWFIEASIWIRSLMITNDSATVALGHLFLINTRSQIFEVFDFAVFAVRDFWEENSILTLSIKVLFVTRVLEIILAWPRVLFAGQIVVNLLVWLKYLSLNLARLEIRLLRSLLSVIFLGVISGRPNGVLAETAISILWHFFWWNGGSAGLWLDHKIIMFVGVVCLTCALKFADVIPLETLIISARAGVIDRGWVLKDSWAGCCWAEAGHLIITFLYWLNYHLPL